MLRGLILASHSHRFAGLDGFCRGEYHIERFPAFFAWAKRLFLTQDSPYEPAAYVEPPGIFVVQLGFGYFEVDFAFRVSHMSDQRSARYLIYA